jgi:hypothetical protein
MKLITHHHLVPRSKIERSYTSTPPIRLHVVVLSQNTGITLPFFTFYTMYVISGVRAELFILLIVVLLLLLWCPELEEDIPKVFTCEKETEPGPGRDSVAPLSLTHTCISRMLLTSRGNGVRNQHCVSLNIEV